MEQETVQKPKCGMAKASLWLGIFAAIFGIAPLLSGWFLALVWLVWILAILSIIFGIIAACKKQPVGKWAVGIVLAIFGICCPWLFAEAFANNAAESVSNAASFLNETGAFE